jgi:hypothetical protein
MQLAEASRQIVQARANVARQREVVAELERDGNEAAALARELLLKFEEVLALQVQDQELLERELGR